MRYLDAVAGLPIDRPPVWLMRQAGRYLPEYREIRAHVSFQEAIADPGVAAELTLQPLRRFPLDAAIIFADIMTPLEAMGVAMTFDPGPKLDVPVTSSRHLRPFDPEGVRPTLDAIGLVRSELDPSVAVIGFCGAPFTLAAYLVQGGGGKDFLAARASAADPESGFEDLLDMLADAMAQYLRAQVDAGANAVQLFDSWAGLLSTETFARLNVPVLRRLLERFGRPVPVTYFAPGASHLLEIVAGLPVDVVGVDWRLSIPEVWRRIGGGDDLATARERSGRSVQGNIDPSVLLAGPDVTHDAVDALLRSAHGAPGHIVNVGHGLTPETPVESVAALVETVTTWQAPAGSR